jgi:hypothetical protein
MKYIIDMESCAMIYTPSFINAGSATQMLIGRGEYRHKEGKEIAEVYLHYLH